MAENELLKSEAEICGTATLECELLGLFDPELLHAAATTAKLAIAAAQATFLATCCKETTRFFPGRMRPPYLPWADLHLSQESHLAEL